MPRMGKPVWSCTQSRTTRESSAPEATGAELAPHRAGDLPTRRRPRHSGCLTRQSRGWRHTSLKTKVIATEW